MKKPFIVTVIIIATGLIAIGCSTKDNKNTIFKESEKSAQVLNTNKESTVVSKEDNNTSEITYTSNDIIIKYPQIKNISDKNKQDKINSLIKDDALSIIKFYDPNNENPTLEVKYKIKLLNDKFISIAYYGYYNNLNNAYPLNFVCSTNIDITRESKIALKDYYNIDSIADTLLNTTNFKSNTEDKNLEKAQFDYIKQKSKEEMLEILSNTDFSSSTEYPLAFSYQSEDSIVISIPLQHAIGDYIECIINK